MSDPIIPKVKKHIVDGDYKQVNSQPKEDKTQSTHTASETKSEHQGWTLSWQMVLASSSVFFLVILYLLYQQEQAQDRLVEAVNQLQTQTAGLTDTLQTQASQQAAQQKSLLVLKKQLLDVEAKIAQLEDPAQQPVVSQADMEAMQQQIAQLKQQVVRLSKKGVSSVQESVQQVLQAPEVQDKLNTVQQKMQQLGERLKGLLEQQNKEASQQPTQSKVFTTLAPEEIKQWAVKINTQWQLIGNVDETKVQLHALAQADAVSDLSNKLDLMKAIGQDEAMLEQWQQSAYTQQLPSIDPLKAWFQQLAHASENTTKNSQNSQSWFSIDTEKSAQERLMAQFAALFSVHKRKDVAQLSATEKVLLKEVLIQRGLLLADELDWALQSHDSESVKRRVQQLTAFVAQYFPERQTEFSKLITPFQSLQFKSRPSLHIVEVL